MTPDERDLKRRIDECMVAQGLCPYCEDFLEPDGRIGIDRCPHCKLATKLSHIPLTIGSAGHANE